MNHPLGTVQPHQYAPAVGLPGHDHYAYAAPARPAQPVPVSHGALYAGLNQTNKDIKSIRGWHGSRLAVATGVVGGLLLAAGGAAAFILTGGLAALGVGAVAAGVAVTVGGSAAGMCKTTFGKRECKKNPQLMEKIVVLTKLREELKANRALLNPEQKQIYKDVRKVDRGTLAKASAMVGRTAAGVAGGAASVLVLAAIGAGAGDGGGDVGCMWWGNAPTIGGAYHGDSSGLDHGHAQEPSGVPMAPDELTKLQTPLGS